MKGGIMAFSATLTMEAGIAKITMSGDLDANMVPVFQKEIEAAAAQKAKHLVLMMSDLEYIASAGLRALVFARQKMGPGVDIYVVGAQQQVMDTIQMTGFDRSIIAVDNYDAKTIKDI
jgi:anti-sigma B factor antagonist